MLLLPRTTFATTELYNGPMVRPGTPSPSSVGEAPCRHPAPARGCDGTASTSTSMAPNSAGPAPRRSGSTARSTGRGEDVARKRDVAPVPPRRRKVRFEVDDNDPERVRATVHTYEKVAEGERKLCWNTAGDIRRMKQELRCEAIHFMLFDPIYVGCLEQLVLSPLLLHRPHAASGWVAASAPPTALDGAEVGASILSRAGVPRRVHHLHKELLTVATLRQQSQLRAMLAPPARSDPSAFGPSRSTLYGANSAATPSADDGTVH